MTASTAYWARRRCRTRGRRSGLARSPSGLGSGLLNWPTGSSSVAPPACRRSDRRSRACAHRSPSAASPISTSTRSPTSPSAANPSSRRRSPTTGATTRSCRCRRSRRSASRLPHLPVAVLLPAPCARLALGRQTGHSMNCRLPRRRHLTEEAPTEVGLLAWIRHPRPYRLTAALFGWLSFPWSADLRVRRRRHKAGEWPLGFDGLGRILSIVRNRGSPDAKEFGEFCLTVVL